MCKIFLFFLYLSAAYLTVVIADAVIMVGLISMLETIHIACSLSLSSSICNNIKVIRTELLGINVQLCCIFVTNYSSHYLFSHNQTQGKMVLLPLLAAHGCGGHKVNIISIHSIVIIIRSMGWKLQNNIQN